MAREPGEWLTADMRDNIKDVLHHIHGIEPNDDDINWGSAGQQNRALGLHESRIVRKLETITVRPLELPAPNHRASELLMEASGCYVEGLFDACIMVSRAAMEAALQMVTGSSHRATLKSMIETANGQGLLDQATTGMAHELRGMGNEFAHYDHQGILGREEAARVGQVVFVGKQPAEQDRPAAEALVKVGTVADRLALKAYSHALRICARLMPATTGTKHTEGAKEGFL